MTWIISKALMKDYENSHFLRGQVVESSVESCLDGEQYAQLNGNHTPQAYCAPDKMTGFSRLSRFGMTFAPLTENRGEDLLMWYLGDFRARISALQMSAATGLTESEAECGEKWRGSFAKYDPNTHSLRTHQYSLLEDSTESCVTLPKSGLMLHGLLYQPQALGRRISETDCGSYARWPTPTRRDYRGANSYQTTQRKLQDGKRAQIDQLPNALQQELGRGIGSTMNPTWVEWLMGWPLGWTDLKPLGTDKFHFVQP